LSINYRADMKKIDVFTLDLWVWPWPSGLCLDYCALAMVSLWRSFLKTYLKNIASV
jgi:hypothetical protein